MGLTRLFVPIFTFVCVYAQCGPRIRVSWDEMTDADRETYLDALEHAMDSGHHMRFTEVHSETLSELEAHRTCGFLLWHRRMLVGYENMLRSLDPRFRCITIPYWNYFADYARRENGECNSLLSCSRILRDMGGSNGPTRTVEINGRNVRGRCVSARPLDHFCQTSTTPSEDCIGCVPRGDWARRNFPSGLGYASLANLMAQGERGYRYMNLEIQYNIHNGMHNALGASMATFASPADPIFYSHHATIDMLHHLYYECHVGRAMTRREKRNSRYAFERCAANGVNNPRSTSPVLMRWDIGGDGQPAVNVLDHETLDDFFDGIPQPYYQYVDTLDMGVESVGYQMGQLIQNLMERDFICPAVNEGPMDRRLKERDLPLRECDVFSNQTDVARENVIEWFDDVYNKTLEVHSNSKAVLEEMEFMECQHHDKYLGGVEDLSEEIKTNMHLKGHLRCKKLLNQHKKVKLDNPEQTFVHHFHQSYVKCHYRH